MVERGMARLGLRLFALLLGLLPEELRRAAGAEMTETFAARQRDAQARGALALVALWIRELGGLMAAAARSRFAGDGRAAGAPVGQGLGQDVRYVTRSLRRSPAFTLTAVTVIALGVAATTGIFSAVNAVLLRPLPFRDPGRLVMVFETNPDRGWDRASAAPANALDWRDRVRAFEDLAMYDEFLSGFTYTGGEAAEQLQYTNVSGNFFDVLGVRPALGPGFTWDDTWDNPRPRAVLAWDTWTTRFGGDPGVVGTVVDFAGAEVEIVGVAPEGFAFPAPESRLWVAYGWALADRDAVFFRRAHWVRAVGRLAAGATAERASAELQTVAADLEREYPQTNVKMGAGLSPLHDFLVGDRRTPLLVLLGAVGLLLLIACANVGSLLLVRAQGKARELAVRRAIGADGGRLARLVLLEAGALTTVGGGLGFLLGVWGVRALDGMRSLTLPGAASLAVDGRVALFTLGTMAVCVALFGLAPALRARRTDPGGALREGNRGGDGVLPVRFTRALVVAELALSLVLVIAAGLMVRSFLALRAVDPGVRIENVMTFRVSAPARRYAGAPEVRAFYEQLEQRLEALPGVEDAAFVRSLPLTTPSWSSDFTVSSEGLAPTGSGSGPATFGEMSSGREILHREVGPGYFEAMEVPLIAGRTITPADGVDDEPVVVVNEAFVRTHFPGENVIGRRIANDRPPTERSLWRTIVGVVGDEHQAGLSVPSRPEVFAPFYQDWNRATTVVMRTRGDPEAVFPGARAVLAEIDPLIASVGPRSMENVLAASLARDRFLLVIVGVFAGAALLLAAVGVYGVTAQATRRRTREIGIRLALGADAAVVRRMVLGQAMATVGVGLALGVAGALAGARVMRALLYEVAPNDAVTFVAVPALLGLVAVVACWVPARRATRVDPISSLRAE
jgi:putative ABC transport system permease protein